MYDPMHRWSYILRQHLSLSFLGAIKFSTLVGLILLSLLISSSASQPNQPIPSNGTISYAKVIMLNVDYGSQIGTNNLELGSQIHWYFYFPTDSELQQRVTDANLKILRFFIPDESHHQPCTSWDDNTHTGTWDWTELDAEIDAAFSCGAEPLLCFNLDMGATIPGMEINPITLAPYPESFAAYVSMIALHFENRGVTIKYWEIFNEHQGAWTWYYDPYIPSNEPIWSAFVDTYNAVASEIRSVFPNASIGTATGCHRGWCEYLAEHGTNIDWIGTHKYDSGWGNQYADDEELFRRAVRGLGYEEYDPRVHDFLFTPNEALDKWEQMTGVRPAFYVTETNLNAEWDPVDHRQHEAIGAVWFAEEIRDFILRGIQYTVQYRLASYAYDPSFGMVEVRGDYTKYYPYFVCQLFGEHLTKDDILFETTSSEETRVSALAWQHAGRAKLLIINKAPDTSTVSIEGLSGEGTLYRLDSSVMEIQLESTILPNTVTMNGYTVVLVDAPSG